MAYMLFKYIRRKVRENRAQKDTFSTADENDLIPNVSPSTPKSHGDELHTGTEARTSRSTHMTHPESAEKTLENERFREEAKRMRRHRWKMIVGLLLPNFLASVDVTIVAPAIPTISSHFSKVNPDSYRMLANFLFRPSQWKLQLDCCCIHAHIHHVRACIWSACRCLWPPFRPPVSDVLDHDRQRPVRIISDVGNALVWQGTARFGGGGSNEPYAHCSV